VSRMPAEKYERGPCPTCGALTEDEAGDKCTPGSDQTGEYSCAGQFDGKGLSVVVTAASLKAIDDWIDANLNAREAQI